MLKDEELLVGNDFAGDAGEVGEARPGAGGQGFEVGPGQGVARLARAPRAGRERRRQNGRSKPGESVASLHEPRRRVRPGGDDGRRRSPGGPAAARSLNGPLRSEADPDREADNSR